MVPIINLFPCELFKMIKPVIISLQIILNLVKLNDFPSYKSIIYPLTNHKIKFLFSICPRITLFVNFIL